MLISSWNMRISWKALEELYELKHKELMFNNKIIGDNALFNVEQENFIISFLLMFEDVVLIVLRKALVKLFNKA